MPIEVQLLVPLAGIVWGGMRRFEWLTPRAARWVLGQPTLSPGRHIVRSRERGLDAPGDQLQGRKPSWAVRSIMTSEGPAPL